MGFMGIGGGSGDFLGKAFGTSAPGMIFNGSTGQSQDIWTPWSKPNGAYQADMSGTPSIPGYVAPKGPTQIDTPQMDQRGLAATQGLALGDTSPWTTHQLAEQNQSMLNQKDAAAAKGSAATQGTWDQIAMNGGLRSGAAERAQEQGQIGTQLAQQGIGQQGEANKLAIQTQGQNQKLQALASLPGQEAAYNQPGMQAQEFNAGLGLQTAGLQNDYNQHLYDTQGKIFAANQLANQQSYDSNNKSLWDKIMPI